MHLDAFGCIRTHLENFEKFGLKNWNFGRDGLCEHYWPVPGGHIYVRCVALSWGGSRLILNGKELSYQRFGKPEPFFQFTFAINFIGFNDTGSGAGC